MGSLQEMIKISEGFSYSVNIEHDIQNITKIKSYIPTDKTIDIIRNYCINDYGSYIIVGSYGTGKSHLMTVLANISQGRYDIEDYDPLVEKIGIRDEETSELLAQKIQNRDKRLVILPDYQADDFNQAMLLGIRKALKNEHLDNIVIDTNFKSILITLDEWEKKYKETYAKFYNILKDEYYISEQEFEHGILRYDYSYYKLFETIYPRVTSGAQFSPYISADICEVMIDLYSEVLAQGYVGIDVIFDEFGSFLESNIEVIEVLTIQSLAELANSGDMNLSLYYVAHKDFSQYGNKVSEMAVTEWRKVEGRFKRYDIYQDPSDIYQLISRVILVDSQLWDNYYKSNLELFEELMEDTIALPTFYELKEEDIYEYVIKGCWPMAPLSAFTLYKLSDLLAQNQRTLFTFLNTDGDGTFINFINNVDKGKWLTGDWIFDYFETLMWSESKESNIYRTWRETKTALNKLGIEEDKTKVKIIKAIGIIYMINDFDRLPPKAQTIEQMLYGSKDLTQHMDDLVKDKILFLRRSTGEFSFFEASDIDIDAELNSIIEKNKDLELEEVLNRDFLPMPLMPRKYNDQNKISRCFVSKYIYISDATYENIAKDRENFNIDGFIYYLIPDSKMEIDLFLKNRTIFRECTNVIFVLPKDVIDLRQDIRAYNGLQELLANEEFIAQDPLLRNELLIYLAETTNMINKKLSVMLNNSYDRVYIISEGEIRNDIKNRYALQQEASRLLKDYYNQSIIINNEMLNKNSPTRTMRTVVAEVIDEIWADNRDEDLGFNEFNAQHTTLRTVLINSGILTIHNERLYDNTRNLSDSDPLRKVFDEVNKYLEKCRYKEQSFSDLYLILKRTPYGLKDGIIPLLLAIPFYNQLKSIYIRRGQHYQDLDGRLLIDMVESPSKYSVSIDVWEKDREDYIVGLEDIFGEYIDVEYSKKNRLAALYKGMKKHYMMLPIFTRVTDKLSENAKNFRDIMERDFTDYRIFFFDILSQEAKFWQVLNNVGDAKDELDNFLDKYSLKLSEDIATIFDISGERQIHEAIDSWKSNLDPAIFSNIFDMRTNLFLQYIQNPMEDFVEGLVFTMTGFKLNALSDEVVDQLLKDIREIKERIENTERGDIISDSDFKIIIRQDDEEHIKTFSKTELGFMGKTLKNRIVKDIEDMGLSLEESEIRTILAEVLEQYI